MHHVLVLYYVFIALAGMAALAVAVLGTLRSHIKSYWLLIVFYAAFTLMVFTQFLRQYLFSSRFSDSFALIAWTRIAGSILTIVFMTSITLYFHHLFLSRYRRIRDGILMGINALSLVLLLWPQAWGIDPARALLIFNPPAQASTVVHLIVFTYVLVVGLFGSKKDRPLRELILIWSLVVFACTGFYESLMSFLRYAATPQVPLVPRGSDFLVSTIPYFLFGGILIYYFGAYVLADRQLAPSLNGVLINKYKLSPREQEVIPLLNQGLSNREIAEKLFVSLATIKTHIHNIYEKTGAKSRYDLFHLTRD